MKELDEKAKNAFIELCNANVFDEENRNKLAELLRIEGFLNGDMGEGYTPLQYAIASAYPHDHAITSVNPDTAIEVAKVLINHGANLTDNRTKYSDYSPVALVIQANIPELLALMLEKGVDPNYETRSGKNLLDIADIYAGVNVITQEDHEQVIKSLLIQYGVKERSEADKFLQSELQKASEEWDMGKINNWARANPDLSWSNINGDTYLHLLSERDAGKDTVAAVYHFINNGKNVDINQQNLAGETPAILAFKCKNVRVLKALVEKGADLTIKDAQEMSVIDYAYAFEEFGEFEAVIDLLEEHEKFVRVKEVSREKPEKSEEEVDHGVVAQEEDGVENEVGNIVDFNSLTPIQQVIQALSNRKDEEKFSLPKSKLENAQFIRNLRTEMKWTAYKPKKLSKAALKDISILMRDGFLQNLNSSFNVQEISEPVQKALFNIIAYTGKLSVEIQRPKVDQQTINKYVAARNFLSAVIKDPSALSENVQLAMTDENITQSRSKLHSYKIHSFFAKKDRSIQSTMHELFYDLSKVLENEPRNDSQDSSAGMK